MQSLKQKNGSQGIALNDITLYRLFDFFAKLDYSNSGEGLVIQ